MIDQFRRPVIVIVGASQFDRRREAFAEIGIFLLNDCRQSVVVEPAGERRQQSEDEEDQAKPRPGA